MELLNPLSVARGHQLFADKRFSAKCLVTDSVGDCVYIRADVDPSGVPQVGKANPKNPAKMPAVGVIIEKSTASDCVFQWIGELPHAGLAHNKPAFVGLDGRITQDPSFLAPDPGEICYVQNMGVAMTSDSLLLLPNFFLVKRVG